MTEREALSATNKEKLSSCGDLISRADAIEAACNEMDWLDDGCVEERKTMIKDALSALPSADIPIGSTNTPTNTPTNLISRQDAYDVLTEYYHHRTDMQHMALKEALGRVPSAIPTGEWIDIDNYYRTAICSHCNKVTMFEKWGKHIKPYNFCPNCGADMIQGGDDE